VKAQTTLAIQLLLIAATTMAQPVTVGALINRGGEYSANSPSTYVDLSHPATGNGTLTSVTFRWSGPTAGCSNNVKVKTVRMSNGFQFTVVAERGPFTPSGTYTPSGEVSTFVLSPGIPVQAGDLLAMTQLQQANCSGISLAFSEPGNIVAQWGADLQTGTATVPTLKRGFTLNARASSDASVLVGVLAAVGSASGNFGSSFKTDVQIMNVDTTLSAGKLVFHPAGRSGIDSDPSLSFSMNGFGKVVFSDVVAKMGLSGVGSMDVISSEGVPPVVTTRVYNDMGAGGTNGFVEPMLDPNEALVSYEQASLQLPADPVNFRMNVGVRTLAAGATIAFDVIDNNTGTSSVFITKTYPPNYFEQVSASALTNVATLPANGSVYFEVEAGSAIVYASTTDNRTNDSAIAFAKHQ
jgi:hypothetical protein